MTDILNPGEKLGIGQRLTSSDRRFEAVLQPDGNFVVYFVRRRRPLWATNTVGILPSSLEMQGGDGNLVLYDSTGLAKWASNTTSNPGSYAIMQNDGNLVVYSPAHRALWASNSVYFPPKRWIVQEEFYCGVLENSSDLETVDESDLWQTANGVGMSPDEAVQDIQAYEFRVCLVTGMEVVGRRNRTIHSEDINE